MPNAIQATSPPLAKAPFDNLLFPKKRHRNPYGQVHHNFTSDPPPDEGGGAQENQRIEAHLGFSQGSEQDRRFQAVLGLFIANNERSRSLLTDPRVKSLRIDVVKGTGFDKSIPGIIETAKSKPQGRVIGTNRRGAIAFSMMGIDTDGKLIGSIVIKEEEVFSSLKSTWRGLGFEFSKMATMYKALTETDPPERVLQPDSLHQIEVEALIDLRNLIESLGEGIIKEGGLKGKDLKRSYNRLLSDLYNEIKILKQQN